MFKVHSHLIVFPDRTFEVIETDIVPNTDLSTEITDIVPNTDLSTEIVWYTIYSRTSMALTPLES